MRKILVTTGLPYANGSLHLGHILENIQADIWVRWQRMRGNSCLFISGDDAHGTPIMIHAEEKGITPEDLVSNFKKEHEKDFADFYITFDNYYTTHSEENKELTYEIYHALNKNNDILNKPVEQFYDDVKNMFLPDRFIKGTCPRCNAENQYGDSCEVCGATYEATELKDPISRLSSKKPTLKLSQHYFFLLPKYTEFLQNWTKENGHLQHEIRHKLDEWFTVGLKPWDISRDKPYFGFEIPDAPQKYFYVWLDAPIGYMASFKNLCEREQSLNFDEYWKKEGATELYHFIGKDIIYFHALFWPAILEGAGFRKPTSIFTHGFLTVNGQKMSKSRGTFIQARDYLNNLSPEYLRYYFASKMNGSIDDLDFSCADFTQKVNSDLVGKVVNIASRCAGFINKNFASTLSTNLPQKELFEQFVACRDSIAKNYEERRYNEAVREIMALADIANKYIDSEKPWSLMKDPDQLNKVQDITTLGLNLFRILIIYLKPILPKLAEDSEAFLNISPLCFDDIKSPLLNHVINQFTPLMQRVELKNVENLFVKSPL